MNLKLEISLNQYSEKRGESLLKIFIFIWFSLIVFKDYIYITIYLSCV